MVNYRSLARIRWLYRAAAASNFAATVPAFVAYERYVRTFTTKAPRYRFLVYIWAGQALLWGVSFLEIARDPVAKYPLIKYSYLEKAVTSACVLSAVSRGTVPRRFGVAIMATDLVWIPAFAYVHAYLAGRIDE